MLSRVAAMLMVANWRGSQQPLGWWEVGLGDMEVATNLYCSQSNQSQTNEKNKAGRVCEIFGHFHTL